MFNEIKQAFLDGLDWLVNQLVAFIDLLFNLVVDVFNFGILALAKLIEFVSGFLPGSSTYGSETIPAVPADGVVNFINWMLPVSSMAAVLAVIVLNYVLYFTVGRLLKVAQII